MSNGRVKRKGRHEGRERKKGESCLLSVLGRGEGGDAVACLLSWAGKSEGETRGERKEWERYHCWFVLGRGGRGVKVRGEGE